MKSFTLTAIGASALASTAIAQNHGDNSWSSYANANSDSWSSYASAASANANANGNGNGNNWGAAPSCMSSCWSGSSWQNGGPTSLCGNTTATDQFNSCVSGSSSCSDSDKNGAYQVLAQICANVGTTVSAAPEATFSATSGGNAWPTTNSAWSSYASAFATITTAPTANPFNATNHPGWNAGAGYGPFGNGGPASGWGSWASQSTGSWTSGPWTSWWGTNGCPPSTWSGWTSGPWGTNAPWTTWTACTASTTGSSVVTTTVTTGGSTSVMTTTALGIQVAQASNSGTASGSAASATSSGSSGERRAVVGAGAGLGGMVAALLMI